MSKQKEFDECVREAISLGRKYMNYPPENKIEPTQQEWDLALILFKDKLELYKEGIF